MAPLPDRMNLPCEESVDSFLTWYGMEPFSLPAEALQSQQPKPLKLLDPEPPVIVEAEPLVFHAAHAPPNPAVQQPQGIPARKPAGDEVLSCASNHLVEFRDD